MTEPNQSELKPCFHCPESMVTCELNDYDFWQVQCGACGSSSGVSKNRETVIEIWNTRPIEDQLRTQLEEARNENIQLVERRLSDLQTLQQENERLRGELDKADRLAASNMRMVLEEQSKVKLLRGALELVNEMSGPNAHRLGCDCGGHNGDGKSCHFLMTKIKEALAATEPKEGE